MQPNICHVVLFCLDAAKVAMVLPDDVLLHHLNVLREKVPGLLELNFGPAGRNLYPDYVDSSNGYTHCLVSKHLDATHLKVYAEHPDHLALVSLLKTSMTRPPLRVDFALGYPKQ
ncbi:diagnostic antigen [Trypanosoma rangeli]|uniref:Diagnostic antigen n=1 Tax=Trypanosoma rangeli TaxID=5698 RepID=A0A422NMP7_TRYRA|nr:diagnostic antigen [Trypanosoma rangeli]RNF06772.1 diagnostic antigen [Trypanosoma rangeli]|eukprot:RNF06772.1 diagnostic antigen [Trypanosoma rangeli]